MSFQQELLLRGFINEDLIISEFPKYIVIEPTNYCNLNCIMCPRGEMTRLQGCMNFELFKKIIDECEDKAEFIYLHFFGEPLLHPRIVDFINYAAGKGMTIALSTNATVLNEIISRELLNSKLDLLIISVDSINPETYAKIRKGGNLENLLKNIDIFLDMQQRLKATLNVSLQMIEMFLNKNEIKMFTSRWKLREGLNLTIKPLYNYADQVKNIHDLGDFPQKNRGRKVCIEPWRGLVIGWDGTVVPCCNDFNYKFPLGNVKVNTLTEIWNSEKMREMRNCQRGGLQKSNDLCKGCLIHHEDYLNAISPISSFNPSRKESYAYFDKGLWNVEIYPEYDCLWTKQYFEISVQDKCRDIRIILCNDNPQNEFVDLQISLFGKIIKNERVGRRTEIVLSTPEQFKGRLLRYGFVLGNDWIPQEAGINEDTRRLGVRIEQISN